MAGKSKESHPKGTLIKSADGALYYISRSNLQAFRVPEKEEPEVDAEFEKLAEAKKKEVAAVECYCEILWMPKGTGRRKPPRK